MSNDIERLADVLFNVYHEGKDPWSDLARFVQLRELDARIAEVEYFTTGWDVEDESIKMVKACANQRIIELQAEKDKLGGEHE